MEERTKKEEKGGEWGISNHGWLGSGLPQYIFLRVTNLYFFYYSVILLFPQIFIPSPISEPMEESWIIIPLNQL